jgi:hypothetical protein
MPEIYKTYPNTLYTPQYICLMRFTLTEFNKLYSHVNTWKNPSEKITKHAHTLFFIISHYKNLRTS